MALADALIDNGYYLIPPQYELGTSLALPQNTHVDSSLPGVII